MTTITVNSSSDHKLSVLEKVGYSLGDLAANLLFQTLMTFLAFYYTDIYGIEPAAAATVMFIGGMFGAFFTPVMGLIADRTNTRWGKFRPWLLWTAVPFGAAAMLMFSDPKFTGDAKVYFALATYILFLIIYAANNLPYAALSGVLTGNMAQRNSLSSYRFVAVLVAQFAIQVFLLPMVLILGEGDRAKGFQDVMIIFSVVGTLCFLIAFFTTKERILPIVEARNSIGQDLSDLVRNIPWLVILFVTVMVFIGLAVRSGTIVYYFENYLDVQAMAAFLQAIGFNGLIASLNQMWTGMGLNKFPWPEDPATSAMSLFNACGVSCMILGIGLSKPLSDRFGKRNVYGITLFVATCLIALFYAFSSTSIGYHFLAQIFQGFIYGITIPILWAMIADVADYAEWKNNRRATAIVFSAMILGLKAGLTVGGTLVGALLSNFNYNAQLDVQAEETLAGIKLMMSIYGAIPFFLAAFSMAFYMINKSMEERLEADLKARRASAKK
jgi:glycoside/pentoside/hexuronide:cation symporter, GPH family